MDLNPKSLLKEGLKIQQIQNFFHLMDFKSKNKIQNPIFFPFFFFYIKGVVWFSSNSAFYVNENEKKTW